MADVLVHCCCAPCSLSVIQPLKDEGFEVSALWYNPNIHPFKEYEARRDCLVSYAEEIEMPLFVIEDYGIRQFVKNVAGNIDARCTYCYEHRLYKAAETAAKKGFEFFTTTLLASLYQNHEKIAEAGERFAKEFGVKFLYRDFRNNFRAGNNEAREKGFYMQKYCGCIFSEEERYSKQILKAKEKFNIEL